MHLKFLKIDSSILQCHFAADLRYTNFHQYIMAINGLVRKLSCFGIRKKRIIDTHHRNEKGNFRFKVSFSSSLLSKSN